MSPDDERLDRGPHNIPEKGGQPKRIALPFSAIADEGSDDAVEAHARLLRLIAPQLQSEGLRLLLERAAAIMLGQRAVIMTDRRQAEAWGQLGHFRRLMQARGTLAARKRVTAEPPEPTWSEALRQSMHRGAVDKKAHLPTHAPDPAEGQAVGELTEAAHGASVKFILPEHLARHFTADQVYELSKKRRRAERQNKRKGRENDADG
jgi:hypothetical protein